MANRRSAALKPGPAGLAMRAGVIVYTLFLAGLPLAAVLIQSLAEGPHTFINAIASPVALDAVRRTLWTSALVAIANGMMGTATAWALTRYRLPGKTILSALIDLPFAVPTLVTGVMLVLLFGPQQRLGGWLGAHGFPIAYANAGIVIALAFVTLPFVVRSVEPVLLELDPAEEEAAQTMGASPFTTFRRVIFPALLPAIALGVLQSFARAIAEFGSVVIISGNIPLKTLTAPVFVFGEIESGNPVSAAAVSVLLLLVAITLSLLTRALRRVGGAHRA